MMYRYRVVLSDALRCCVHRPDPFLLSKREGRGPYSYRYDVSIGQDFNFIPDD